MNRKRKIIFVLGAVLFLFITMGAVKVFAEPDVNHIPIPKVDVSVGNPETPQEYVDNIKLLILFTVLSLLPSIIMMTTAFIRIIIVLSLFKNAIGAQQAIPKQVLIGLALFLTFFIMAPTFDSINENAVKPYLDNRITQEEAIEKGTKPMREFMLRQTNVKDLELFIELGKVEDKIEVVENNGVKNISYDKVPIHVIIPAFMISELKTAFQIGFLIFIPFLIIDIVTGSVLMSMGMFMVPPVMVALPFKLLLFVMVDGWHLLVKALITSFS